MGVHRDKYSLSVSATPFQEVLHLYSIINTPQIETYKHTQNPWWYTLRIYGYRSC